MKDYDHREIERRWQERWERDESNKASDVGDKYYVLMEFPYPSGDGLHTGHVRGYTAMDIVARKRRAEGKNVLFPIGWDAFGLPTENYAIKTGIHPALVTKQNTDNFRRQFKSLGMSFDWSREVNTTEPLYYKWTQWIFLQFFKKGLAYKTKSEINWCPKDKVGLANEEAAGGVCDRCGGPVEKREKEQWMLAITKYADRLDKDLDTVDYWDKIKTQQRNWIGRSEGAEIEFSIADSELRIKVFTTRADTIFGATYLVLAPEHELVKNLEGKVQNWEEVQNYIETTKNKSDLERQESKEKTGVQLKGVTAINPATKQEIPVWIADYVLPHYGTGAIMAVPAHDERDWQFARKYNLPIKHVIEPVESQTSGGTDDALSERNDEWHALDEHEGVLVDSGKFTGMKSVEAKMAITEAVGGTTVTKYKLRDWVFSRQRYWGEPIPLVHCKKDGWVAVPDEQLPVVLPDLEDFKPTETGDSSLAKAVDWINTTCPTCHGPAKRETDVMPQWAGSSWYYLRYTDPNNDTDFASKNILQYWTPVDWYNGGMEHTTLHLLYSRFWHKFLFDEGVVPTSEPYAKRTSHGLILAEGGVKMSKSKGNVINPDDIVDRFGADTLRLYEMFMGPFEEAVVWSEESIIGPRRFIERVWRLREKISPTMSTSSVEVHVHKTVKKVSEDIESLALNTAVSALMILASNLDKQEQVRRQDYETLLRLLAPFAPHVTEELWEALGNSGSIHHTPWPTYDPEKLLEESVELVVQVNGKVRATLMLPRGTDEKGAKELVFALPKIKEIVGDSEPKKIIYVADRIFNIVV